MPDRELLEPHLTEDIDNMASNGISHRIQFLRDIRDVFGTSFKIVPADPGDPENHELLLSCYGTGYINTNKPVA